MHSPHEPKDPTDAPHRTDHDRRPTNHSGASTYRLTNMAMTKAAADEQIPSLPSIDEL